MNPGLGTGPFHSEPSGEHRCRVLSSDWITWRHRATRPVLVGEETAFNPCRGRPRRPDAILASNPDPYSSGFSGLQWLTRPGQTDLIRHMQAMYAHTTMMISDLNFSFFLLPALRCFQQAPGQGRARLVVAQCAAGPRSVPEPNRRHLQPCRINHYCCLSLLTFN